MRLLPRTKKGYCFLQKNKDKKKPIKSRLLISPNESYLLNFQEKLQKLNMVKERVFDLKNILKTGVDKNN